MRNDEPGTSESDIDALRQRLGLSGLDYPDLSVRRELEQAIARWPLLAELAPRAALPSGAASREEVPA